MARGPIFDHKVHLRPPRQRADTTTVLPSDLVIRRHGGIIASNIGAAGTGAFITYGMPALTFDGTPGSVISADPSSAPTPGWNDGEVVALNHTTTAANGNKAGHRTPSAASPTTTGMFRRRHLPRVRVVWRAGVDQAVSIDNCRIWIGLFSNTPATTDDPAGHVAGFRWSTASGGAGDTTFKAISKDGTTLRATDTGIAHSIGRVYLFDIDLRTAGQITYRIDERVVDRTTVSLPDNNTDLAWHFAVVNGNGGSAATIRMSAMVWDSD